MTDLDLIRIARKRALALCEEAGRLLQQLREWEFDTQACADEPAQSAAKAKRAA